MIFLDVTQFESDYIDIWEFCWKLIHYQNKKRWKHILPIHIRSKEAFCRYVPGYLTSKRSNIKLYVHSYYSLIQANKPQIDCIDILNNPL